MMLRRPYQIMLLCAVVLGIYYPALFAEVSIVDDLDMVNNLFNSHGIDFKELFFPRTANGGYYRPLIGITYQLDNLLWAMDSVVIHTENVVLHLVNALLVYYLTFMLLPQCRKAASQLPLGAGLLFGLHPIATESVNWLSGRTDILSTLFVLSATIFLLKFRDSRSLLTGMVSAGALLLGILTKEVALGFILGAPFILRSMPLDSEPLLPVSAEDRAVSFRQFLVFLLLASLSFLVLLMYDKAWLVVFTGCSYLLYLHYGRVIGKGEERGHLQRLKAILILIAAGIATVGLFYILRRIAFSSDISRISQTLKLMINDSTYALTIFLGAGAFYVKKFFIPVPLNFYIKEIDPLYSLLGVYVFFAVLYLSTRRTITAGLSLAGVCLFLPALPLAFGTIAWTAYAERYIYTSAAFWIIALACTGAAYLPARQGNTGRPPVATIMILFIILGCGTVTLCRNFIWQTNIALLRDSVTQSPQSRPLRGLLMIAHVMKEEYGPARLQYAAACSLPTCLYDEKFDLVMAGIAAKEKKYEEAETFYRKALTKTGEKSSSVLASYVSYLSDRLQNTCDPKEKTTLRNTLIAYNEKLNELQKDPLLTYRMGQVALAIGDRENALKYFNLAYTRLPAGNEFRIYSAKIIARLNKK